MPKAMFVPKTPDVHSQVAEYAKLRDQSKLIKTRMDELSKIIKDYSQKNGVKDDKGSFYCENESYVFGQQARKSVSLDQEKSIAFLKQHGFPSAIKTIEQVNEEEVERLLQEGSLSIDDITTLSNVKVSYSIDVREKEEMPYVDVQTLQAAQRR